MQYLGEINREGITVICSLHFLSLARRYGNRVLALKDGKVVFEGVPNQIRQRTLQADLRAGRGRDLTPATWLDITDFSLSA
jgi:ABC-type phosphate/phosphonate transport system ATPase subunit